MMQFLAICGLSFIVILDHIGLCVLNHKIESHIKERH